MSDIKFTYMVLKLLELLIFCIFGYVLSKTKSKREYWTKASIPILTYAIITGLRFGRQIDWNAYYFRYVNLGANVKLEEYEPMFEWVCNTLYNLGVSYPIFIMLQCTFLMFAILLLVSNYRKQATFILPLILPLITGNEMLIRWYIAVSFLLLSFNALIHNRNKWVYIWFLCAFLNHAGIVILLPILILNKNISRLSINNKVAVCLLFATSIILNISHFGFLISITNRLISAGFGDLGGLTKYLFQIENLINGEFGNTGYMIRSLISRFIFFLATAPIIWFAKPISEKYKCGTYFYNLFVISAILHIPFSSIEILGRYTAPLYMLYMLIGGIVFYEVWQGRNKIRVSIISLCILCFISSYYIPVRNLINTDQDNEMLFIWDSNGRDFLPTWNKIR